MDDDLFARSVAELTAADPRLADLVATHGAPTLWLRPTGFPSLVLFILEQQVSLASAAAAYRKVLDRIGTMAPAALLATTPDELRLDGVSRQKDRYLRALAEAVETGDLDLDGLAHLDDDAVRSALTALPGIGRWTADVYLLACLGRPDLWPVGDRALQVAAAESPRPRRRSPTRRPSRCWASAGDRTGRPPHGCCGTATSCRGAAGRDISSRPRPVAACTPPSPSAGTWNCPDSATPLPARLVSRR